jgi:hypothetical protein
MLLAGHTVPEVIDKIRTKLNAATVPRLEAGAMSYMMSKNSYLTDVGDHNGPHLMIYMPMADASAWGAGLPGSPVGFGQYWFSEKANRTPNDLPTIVVFTVRLGKWSDGTDVSAHKE